MIRGWCPTAWRPMAAGDGLLVRVRPSLGRLTREQMLGLCDAALAWGNGQIDVTNRANLQIRGVAEDGLVAQTDVPMRGLDRDGTDAYAKQSEADRHMADRILDADGDQCVGRESEPGDALRAGGDRVAEHPLGDDPVLHQHGGGFRLRAGGVQDVVEPVVHRVSARSYQASS